MPLTQAERNARYLASPKGQFAKHRQNAYQRGVEFLLTFDQWWNIWQKSGHWKKRGNRSGRYVMARHEDEGPYKVGNVRIELFNANVATRNRTVVKKRHTAKTTTVQYETKGPTWSGSKGRESHPALENWVDVTDTIEGAESAPF